MAGDKGPRKKKKAGGKAAKRKAKEHRSGGKSGGKSGGEGSGKEESRDVAQKRNPKAFIFSSSGRAKVQKARSAEKDQRRMHGEPPLLSEFQ